MNRVLSYAMNMPWAITQEAMETVLEIASRSHEHPEAIQTSTGKKLDNTRRVRVRNGVAVIPVSGPIFRYANLFTALSGATSSEILAQDISEAVRRPEVESILLDIDSPGGMVNGTQELGELIFQARGAKPITAFVSGLGASAAYWIASAASEVVAGPTSMLGSIGTVLEVVDFSGADKKRGIRRMEIVSSQSPKKRGDPFEEDDARAELQQLVDNISTVFIDAVARNRDVTVETVLSDFGQGGILVGEDAVAAGLADRLSTLEDVIGEMASTGSGSTGPKAAFPDHWTFEPRSNGAHTTEEETMPKEKKPEAEAPTIDRAYLESNHPELLEEVRAEAAGAERKRILGIQGLGGPEKVTAECVDDPKTSVGDAAVRILAAKEEREKARATAHLKVRAETEEELEAPDPSATAHTEVTEERARAKRIVSLHNQLKGRDHVAAA